MWPSSSAYPAAVAHRERSSLASLGYRYAWRFAGRFMLGYWGGNFYYEIGVKDKSRRWRSAPLSRETRRHEG